MDVLSCRDRWGRTIFLPQTNWDDKILLDHPELIGNEESVRQTLTDPDLVAHDVDYPDRESFYRRRALPPPDDQDFLKVSVGFTQGATGEPIGRVITAYSIVGIKRGERTKWAKRSGRPR